MHEGWSGAVGEDVSSSAAPGRAFRRHLASRSRADQRGVSLVEMLVAIVLAGSAFLAVVGALLTVIRSTDLNERLQAVDTGLVSYGEILQTQVQYLPCPGRPGGSILDDYQVGYVGGPDGYVEGAAQYYTAGNSSGVVLWRRPSNMGAGVVSVRSWNRDTQEWNAGCTAPDTGVQLVRYKISSCPVDTEDAGCAGGKPRYAEVVKRKGGPS